MKYLDSIKNSRNLLLVTPDVLSIDTVAATFTLGKILKDLGKNITILTNTDSFQINYTSDFDTNSIKPIKKIAPNTFYFELPTDREVKDVNVERTENTFKVTVNTRSGRLIDPDISFRQAKLNFDLILLLGLNTLASSKEFYSSFGTDIQKTSILHLGYVGEDTKETYLKLSERSGTLSEDVLVLASQLNAKIKSSHATNLVAGILDNTQNLRINTNKKTLKNINYLVQQKNASIFLANQKVNSRLTREQIVWHQEVFAHLETKGSLSYAVLDNPLITSKLFSNLSAADRVPFSKMRSCKVAMVLISLNNKTHGFVQSNTNHISALEATKTYDQLGNKSFVYFWTNDKPDAVIDFVNKFVAKKTTALSNKGQPAAVDASNPGKQTAADKRKEEAHQPLKKQNKSDNPEKKEKTANRDKTPDLSDETKSSETTLTPKTSDPLPAAEEWNEY